jgi:conflict system STAND superfamily ATPase
LTSGALPGSNRWPTIVFTPTDHPLAALTSHIAALIVVGVRADFYAACANYSPLRTALQDNPLVVGPMSDTELREAIRYPAQNVGLDIGEGLVELLLRDLGNTATTAGGRGMTGYEAGRLPLLAHALRATWQQRHGHTLTVEGYRSTGGLPRAVATTADRVFTSLDPVGQQAARTLFLRLIKDTRRWVARTDLLRGLDPGSVLPVVDAFTRGRLLTQERDTVEITHEALLHACRPTPSLWAHRWPATPAPSSRWCSVPMGAPWPAAATTRPCGCGG